VTSKSIFVSTYGTFRFLCIEGVICLFTAAFAFGLAESTGPGGSNVQAVHDLGYQGQGVSIGLISISNVLDTHDAFDDALGNPRAFNLDIGNGIVPPPPELPNHDTQAAGIAMARGTGTRPEDNGAAPAAGLYSVAISTSADFANAVKALVEAPQNCRVIMTVIQDTNTSENSFLPLLYDYYGYTYNVVFANAAGNNHTSYPYNTPLTNPGAAYNGITTGGLITTSSTAIYDKIGSLSLAGPTADGRQKPDVCAPSPWQMAPAYTSDTTWATVPSGTQGYTSYAVPHTAGVAAVLLSYANSTAGIANDGRNEVIKAVIVNAAFANILDKAGNATIAPADADWPWQTDRGYGRLDALRAFETLSAPPITPGLSTSHHAGWTYDILSSGESNSYSITGVVNERLVVTLAWNRRIVWNDSFGQGVIQNGELDGYLENLDLEIRDPDGAVVSPAPSTVDNLEKCDLLLAKTGTYEIRVVNQSPDEFAGYGLAFEVLPPLGGDVHVDYVVDTLDVIDLAEHWLSTGCTNPNEACFAFNLGGNARIDLADFAVLAEHWLATDARYYAP
jgi:hypothetical protein